MFGMARRVELGDRGVLVPGRLRWLRALGWMLLCLLGTLLAFRIGYRTTLMAAASFVDGVALDRMRGPAALQLIANAVGAGLVLLVYLLLVRLGEKRVASELDPRAALPETAIGLAIGAAMMAMAALILWGTGWARYAPATINGASNAIGLSLRSGIVEEVLFRLVLLRLIWRAVGIWPALALSALFFGGLHLRNPGASWFAAVAIAFEAGILLAAFYMLTGRLWVSIGLHAGWNFTQGWLLGAPVSGSRAFAGGPLKMQPTPGVPEWMSGGAFGPEASIGVLLLSTLVGLWVLWIAWRKGRLGS